MSASKRDSDRGGRGETRGKGKATGGGRGWDGGRERERREKRLSKIIFGNKSHKKTTKKNRSKNENHIRL